MKRYPVYFLIWLIIILGFMVRVYRLGENPPGFFCDEASIGYNAYSLLKIGRDEYGVPHPFHFRSFGEYRNPVAIYTTIPFVALGGLNEFSVRLAAALIGTLTLLVVYSLVKELFRNRLAATASLLFLAISPWHIQFSRFAIEEVHFVFWFCLALWFFIRALRKLAYFPFSFLFFGIAFYTYKPSQFIIPFFLLGLFCIYRKRIKIALREKVFWVGIAIFCLALFPFILGFQSGASLVRWQMVSVFKEASLSENFSQIAKAYFAHFSFDFLFKRGDIDYPGHFITRFSVRGLGELYLFQLPLLILGFLSYLKFKDHKKSYLVLLLWFLLYPLGSSLTRTDGGGPLAFRSFFGVVPFQILSGLGFGFLAQLTSRLKFFSFLRKGLVLILIIFSATSFFSYLGKYHQRYPLYSSDFWGWQYGPREIMTYFKAHSSEYDDLFLMGNFNSPEIFLKFYDPQNSCQGKCRIGDLNYFTPQGRQLFAVGADRLGEIPPYLRLEEKQVILYPNKKPAFIIGVLKTRSNYYVQ